MSTFMQKLYLKLRQEKVKNMFALKRWKSGSLQPSEFTAKFFQSLQIYFDFLYSIGIIQVTSWPHVNDTHNQLFISDLYRTFRICSTTRPWAKIWTNSCNKIPKTFSTKWKAPSRQLWPISLKWSCPVHSISLHTKTCFYPKAAEQHPPNQIETEF